MNRNRDGVSVIIPTFNRANFLYSTLICLCNQVITSNLEYEIIVIDSGKDDTYKLVAMFQKEKNVSIRYKSVKENKNRSLLRNTGAEIARYSILCFLGWATTAVECS